ncbi:hypothetical protein PILCRDRAFT_811696 [Piloderma croceum F 1598]|uniref:Uncharacterized protein n=1 Tax=Piloderma croceum (strain F 1598) TaxID=765440 RepID=A0A0C3GKQ1_PILCF|nr:hypothetical protein PILCRDRAFT_811696 [Piloderma croceum F 1598]
MWNGVVRNMTGWKYDGNIIPKNAAPPMASHFPRKASATYVAIGSPSTESINSCVC